MSDKGGAARPHDGKDDTQAGSQPHTNTISALDIFLYLEDLEARFEDDKPE